MLKNSVMLLLLLVCWIMHSCRCGNIRDPEEGKRFVSYLVGTYDKYEDVNQAEIVFRAMQHHDELAWSNEKGKFLELMSGLEIKAAEDTEVQVPWERLSLADCAVKRLTRTRVELQDELHMMQAEMSSTHSKIRELRELKQVALPLQRARDGKDESLSRALHSESIALDSTQAGLVDKERIIHELSEHLSSLHGAQRKCVVMQQENLVKPRICKRRHSIVRCMDRNLP